MAGSGGDHWTFVGVVIVAEALDLVVWDPPEPLSLLISPDWLLRLTCYYGVNDDVVHVRASQSWNISDFFPAAVDTGPTAEWGTWLE